MNPWSACRDVLINSVKSFADRNDFFAGGQYVYLPALEPESETSEGPDFFVRTPSGMGRKCQQMSQTNDAVGAKGAYETLLEREITSFCSHFDPNSLRLSLDFAVISSHWCQVRLALSQTLEFIRTWVFRDALFREHWLLVVLLALGILFCYQSGWG